MALIACGEFVNFGLKHLQEPCCNDLSVVFGSFCYCFFIIFIWPDSDQSNNQNKSDKH